MQLLYENSWNQTSQHRQPYQVLRQPIGYARTGRPIRGVARIWGWKARLMWNRCWSGPTNCVGSIYVRDHFRLQLAF
jgi:hypothetical protein